MNRTYASFGPFGLIGKYGMYIHGSIHGVFGSCLTSAPLIAVFCPSGGDSGFDAVISVRHHAGANAPTKCMEYSLCLQ